MTPLAPLSLALILLGSASASAADETSRWQQTIEQASLEKKPIVALFRTSACRRCDELEELSLPHPAIQRRLPQVIFVVVPAEKGPAATHWRSTDPGVALFDRSGRLLIRWPVVPDTMNLGVILDSISAVAPNLERAIQLREQGRSEQGEIETAIALGRLGFHGDARRALNRLQMHRTAEIRQAAVLEVAVIDAREGRTTEAVRSLDAITREPASRKITAAAWLARGVIERSTAAGDGGVGSFTKAMELSEAGSETFAAAKQAILNLESAPAGVAQIIRILPLSRQVVSGIETVRTQVSSTAVGRVVFLLDGSEVARAERPPFSAKIDFGRLPERHLLRVEALDRKGRRLGIDERLVNDAGESFRLRLVAPQEGEAAGAVRVSVSLQVPVAETLKRLVISWNEVTLATLKAPPFETTIEIPAGSVGILRTVAELESGASSEDAVVLNAGGMSERADVQLVELPITAMGEGGAPAVVRPRDLRVREGTKLREVVSIAGATETPLTVGLLIDTSSSMQRTLPDVQEAAIRFLRTVLGEGDRAFLVIFDTRAHLLQPPTTELSLLDRKIMSLRPDGLTALHDAVALGLLQFEGVRGRRALVVFSDGIDVTSRYTAGDVIELARHVNVPVHFIASLPATPAALVQRSEASQWITPVIADEPDEVLQRLPASSGGTSQTLREMESLDAVFARIEAALRAQVVAFIRTERGRGENEWRNITVELEGEKTTVFAPAGYYAPW